MTRYVALLHSIVLTPEKRVVMSELRAMAEELGLANPRTVVATGNLVFESAAAPIAALESGLEEAFRARFGRHVDIILREAEAWLALAAGNPFAAEAKEDASRVIVRVTRQPLAPETTTRLAAYLTEGERAAVVNGDLWLHFSGQPSRTKLLPALTPKRLGVGTMRNWNTVERISALLG